nr:hypothetical protein [Tanacetum cinerariifolium]
MTKTKSFERNSKHKALYHALMESILKDEDAMDKDQGLKRKKTGKETKPSKKAKSTGTSKGTTKSQSKSTGKSAQAKETDWFKKLKTPSTLDPEWNKGKSVENKLTQKWICDLAKAEKPSKTFDDLMITLIDFNAFVMNRLHIRDLTQDILVGLAYELLKGMYRSYVEVDYNIKECYKALTDKINWNNPEGDRYPFDLSKPLPLVKSGNRQIVPIDYFLYFQGESTGRTYTTSLTKTKAAKYDLKGIKDMGPKRRRFYGYASKKVSKHDVYSTKRILAVTNVKVNIWYGYHHLEEIEVQRSDQKLYKFKEGDFPRLHLNGIKDMLLLFNRVEDLQLGVESYQKKLNISKPRTREEYLSRRSPYTTPLNPQGVIYEDKLNRKRLIRFDELCKFSEGTLQSVQDTIHDMPTNLRMGYNKSMPKRIWTHLDKKRSHIMVKEIDHQLRERRLMRSLDKFVGGIHYGEDLRLL